MEAGTRVKFSQEYLDTFIDLKHKEIASKKIGTVLSKFSDTKTIRVKWDCNSGLIGSMYLRKYITELTINL